jgi:hypothetical protein
MFEEDNFLIILEELVQNNYFYENLRHSYPGSRHVSSCCRVVTAHPRAPCHPPDEEIAKTNGLFPILRKTCSINSVTRSTFNPSRAARVLL